MLRLFIYAGNLYVMLFNSPLRAKVSNINNKSGGWGWIRTNMDGVADRCIRYFATQPYKFIYVHMTYIQDIH